MKKAVDERIELVRKRSDVLSVLEGSSLGLRAIEGRTDSSRSTVSRAVRELEAAGLVRRGEDGYELTTVGQVGLEHYRSYRRGWADLIDAETLLESLPEDTDLDVSVIAGSDPVTAPETTPYQPIERLHDAVRTADDCRALLPALSDPRTVRLLYEHVVTDGQSAELVVSPDLRASLVENFPRQMAAMAEDEFELLVSDVPEVGVVLTDHDGDRRLTLVVVGADGVAGVLQNDRAAAVRWAERLYADAAADADPATNTVRQPSEHATDTGKTQPRPPVQLEREGFVRLTRDYFVAREVADPVTAWRAGLDLAEVHTGYAVERTATPAPGETDAPDADTDTDTNADTNGRETLTDRLLETLSAGEDCVLVGPPGSGKSTTVKQVACEWHERERGPVLYRESGHGTAVESVDDLVATLEATTDHALVVVEDVVRPEAAAVLEAAEALADAPVSFLFDARESEWRAPPETVRERLERLAPRVETMPRLLDEDCERLVEHFEHTAGVDVDVPLERLREQVRSPTSGAEGDGPAPGETLLLLHRLATYADPLVEGETSLEADAAAVYDDLAAAGDLALDVGVAANLLNAAGVGVAPAHLHAVAATDTDDDDSRSTDLETALARLDGRVLFGVTDGTYRTVHDAWSTAFLAHLLDEAGEAAARARVERVVSALLSLADAARRERLRAAVDDPTPLDSVAVDPDGWVDRTVDAVFTLAAERPKLAPLLGDGETVVDLPGVTGAGEDERALRLARAFTNAGEYDRAEAALETVPDDERDVDWLLATAETKRLRGEYDPAASFAERALEAATDDVAAARARAELGRTQTARGDAAQAREHLSDALATLEAAGDRRRMVTCLDALGVATRAVGDPEAATEHFERGIELAREVGDRQGQHRILNHLGTVATDRGEYDRARRCHYESIEVARQLGARADLASALNNLGRIEINLNDLESAERHLEECLSVSQAIDDRDEEMIAVLNLATVAGQRGEYDRAEELYQEGLRIAEAIGDRRTQAIALDNLGPLAVRRGDLETGKRRLERALEIAAEVGDPLVTARVCNDLGSVTLTRGDPGAAESHVQRALELRREADDRRGEAVSLGGLARVALQKDEYDRARALAVESRDLFDDLGIDAGRADPEAVLGGVALERGDHETAREHLERALALLADAGDIERTLDVRERLAELERAVGDPEAAEDHCRRAIAEIEAAERPFEHRRERLERLCDRVEASAGADQ